MRYLSSLLICALLAPAVFVGSSRAGSFGNTSQSSRTPLTASEPFSFTTEQTLPGKVSGAIAGFAGGTWMNFSNILTVPEIPAGLGAAKAPSVIDNLSSGVFAAWQTSAVYFGLASSSPAAVAAAAMPVPLAPSGTASFDYDGDGKADLSRWQSSNGEWRIKSSFDGTVSNQTLGWSSDKIVPADYDADSKTDIASFGAASGAWAIKQSSTSTTIYRTFGQAGDIPVSANYGGDSRADIAVFRPSNSTWYYIVTGDPTNTIISQQWGASGDVAVPGNYDGDSKADFAVFRPSTGYWFVLLSSNGGMMSIQWGLSSDTLVPADYDGDGKTDCAVYRPSNGTWYAYKSSTNNGTYIAQIWGNWGDQPVPADYNNDGRADFAVWRPKTGVWHIAETNGSSYNYTYQQFGATGDLPTPAAYLKKIGSSVAMPWIHKERLSPKNATGGTDLYSQNFSWGSGLVGLPGRAGLDAGFGISYNSLIWARVPTDTETAIIFDPDSSNLTPGFRFGFPVIEQNYSDYRTGRFTYIMTTPSGARVDFRQIAASDTYETGDSSYTQLQIVNKSGPNTPVENLKITVTSADGTQMKYDWLAGLFRCSEIKDRNGNKITVSYDSTGLLKTVTDTLGRIITVNYDADLYPTSITQTWQNTNGTGTNVQHNWATFSYGTATITTAFDANLSLYGPASGTVLKVLNRITRADDSYTTFDYNAYGQVWRVNNYAKDNHKLSHIATNLETVSGVQTDCPRFKDTKTWAENFNQNQEVVVTSLKETITMQGLSEPVTRITVTAPDGITPSGVVVDKSYMLQSSWREALPFQTETCTSTNCTGTDKKRWTSTTWTQDDNSLTYPVNPRVAETTVSDAANSKKTEIIYETVVGQPTVANYGRVKEQKIYNNLTNQLLKYSSIGYKDDVAYISRRILGLPSKTEIYGLNGQGAMTLAAKTTYEYDEGNLSDSTLEQNISPNTGHDTTNYGTSFVSGRGNLTKTTRCDASLSSSTTCAGGIESTAKYNTVGAVVSQTAPGSATGTTRTVKISYADKFNDNNNSRGTYAYPTKITDPAGNYSEVKYRFDIGANVWASSPTPVGNSRGKETTRTFDSIGRLDKESIWKTVQQSFVEYAYTRYEYQHNGIQSKVYSTIVDTSNNGKGDAPDEVLSEIFTDGTGRTIKSRTENPASTGGWSGSLIDYDVLGRVKKQSVPTEIDSNWTPAGDDAARGWLWSQSEYDWKGRIKRIVQPDSINLNDGKDQLFDYDGCGCAGGEVTTIKGETVIQDNNGQSQTLGRRTQKVYSDILGRQSKVQILNWDNSVYSTVTTKYNERDQVVVNKQYQGAETGDGSCPTGTCQQTTSSYDGHGRLKTTHLPIEDAGTVTTRNYNDDDSVSSVIDARGATINYTYGDVRGLLTNISYNSPDAANIPVPPSVTYGYDAVGNRTSMIEKIGTTTVGSMAYAYDELSQLVSETRTFDGLSGSFNLSYNYHLSGQVKSITDPFGAAVTYVQDKLGRTEKIDGNGFSNVTNYLRDIRYRAFGGIKQMTYGTQDSAQVNIGYNNRLQIGSYQAASSLFTGGFIQKATYEYYNDGLRKAVNNIADDKFDQTFKYDQAGRLTENQFGMGQKPDGTQARIYNQTLSYNVFSNMTSRQTASWGYPANFTAAYTNNRPQVTAINHLLFDAAGNTTQTRENRITQQMKYDAAGRLAENTEIRPTTTYAYRTTNSYSSYDGDGRRIKESSQSSGTNPKTTYYLYSSVTGKLATELDEQGAKKATKVYLGDKLIAEQRVFQPDPGWSGWTGVIWQHTDPVTGGYQRTIASGAFSSYGDPDARREYEPMGAAVELEAPPSFEPDPEMPNYRYGGEVDRPEMGCELNGTPIRCDLLGSAIHATGGAQNLVGIAFRHQGYMPSLQGGPNPYAFRTATVGTRVDIRTCDGGNCGNWDYGQIESSLSILSAFNEATKLSAQEVSNIKEKLVNILKDKSCADFINAVIGELPDGTFHNGEKNSKFKGTLLENFDRVANAKLGGFYSDSSEKAQAHFSHNGNKHKQGRLSINPTYTKLDSQKKLAFRYLDHGAFPSSAPDLLRNTNLTESHHGMFTLIHELIHAYYEPFGVSGPVEHLVMEDATERAVKKLGLKPIAQALKAKDSTGFDARYFNSVLAEACKNAKLTP